MITFLDLYNKITGQAWSMFDGEIEDQEEFETNVTTSIQKALSALWCSYKFPFRYKTARFITKNDRNTYELPNGNIVKRFVNRQEKYIVTCNGKFLDFNQNCIYKEAASGEPEEFGIKNDKLFLYPTPDNKKYNIEIEYLSIFAAMTKDGVAKANLENDTDYINISSKYEDLFLNTIMPLAMTYLIASDTDENFSQYYAQYEKAYKILIEFTRGIDTVKRYGW